MVGHPLCEISDGSAECAEWALWVQTAVTGQAQTGSNQGRILGVDRCVLATKGVLDPMGDVVGMRKKTWWCRNAVGGRPRSVVDHVRGEGCRRGRVKLATAA